MDSHSVKTGSDLKKWRGGRTQAEVARVLRTSQRMISACESATREELPVKILARLRGENHEEGIESSSHSWPKSLWESIRSKSLKQAEAVTVRAVISPSAKDGLLYADYISELRFDSLVIPEGQTLHLDHVRDPGDDRSNIFFLGYRRPKDAPFNLILGGTKQMPDSMQMVDGKLHEVLVRQGEGALLLDYEKEENDGRSEGLHAVKIKEFGTPRARVIEDQRLHLPAFLSYELQADQRDPVKIYIRSDEGFNITKSDAVGFTYYTEADFIVEKISLEVEFRGGLLPNPDPPSARAQLIRRTSVRPNSLHPTFPNPTKSEGVTDKTGTSVIYKFGPLLRPKGGYLYSLVWNSITPPPGSIK